MPTLIAVPGIAGVGCLAVPIAGPTVGIPGVAGVACQAPATTGSSRIAPSPAAVTLAAATVASLAVTIGVPAVAAVNLQAFRPSTAVPGPQGRQGIAVNQAPSGSNYPFVLPASEDVSQLIGDFYLSYQDNQNSFQRPFHLAWLYGFGDVPYGPIAGYPTPTHAYDLQVADANDAVVFDSTLAGTVCYTRYWGAWLQIVEWQSPTQVCRIVVYTAWGPNDTPRTYNLAITPVQAVLDARSCEQLPLRVLAFQFGLETLSGNVEFVNGYNTTIVPAAATPADGGPIGSTVTFAAAPGSGAGQYDGCNDQQPFIQRINGQAPDSGNNFTLDAEDCYRFERPSTLAGESPPIATIVAATLQLLNDCGPCCECQDFLNVYAALQNLWNLYQDLGAKAMRARDNFAVVISQYNAVKNLCPTNLRIGLAAVAGNIVSVQLKYCNTTNAAILGGLMTLQIADTADPSLADHIGLIAGQTFVTGDGETPTQGFGNTVLTGNYPNYSYDFDKIVPGANATLTFQLIYPVKYFPGAIDVTIGVNFLGLAANGAVTTMPVLEVS